MISSGRLAKLEGELALQKSLTEQMKQNQLEVSFPLVNLPYTSRIWYRQKSKQIVTTTISGETQSDKFKHVPGTIYVLYSLNCLILRNFYTSFSPIFPFLTFLQQLFTVSESTFFRNHILQTLSTSFFRLSLPVKVNFSNRLDLLKSVWKTKPPPPPSPHAYFCLFCIFCLFSIYFIHFKQPVILSYTTVHSCT